MKRRIATLLTLALSTALLLGGCGGSSDTGATNNNSDNSSGGFLSNVTSSKSDTLSEVLSTGKVIAYKVGSVDKATTPDTLYFFDNGKVTLIPGKEFGLTMGDFAKMSDDEIWEKYQTVKETWSENCITQQKEESQNIIGQLQEVGAEAKAVIEAEQWLIDNMDYEMLSVELPFSFVVFTDSSGNNVESEDMVYPEFYLDSEKRTRGYGLTRLSFVLGSTRQEQIYDTTYNCISFRDNGSFLTRETMDIDTLDSKNVLIDLSDSEMKELFKDEFTSRFE